MPSILKLASALVVVCIAAASAPSGASAITVEVARKCETLVAKTFPPREVGNPAAGSAKGTPHTQRDFFNKCVANGGKVDDDTTTKDTK